MSVTWVSLIANTMLIWDVKLTKSINMQAGIHVLYRRSEYTLHVSCSRKLTADTDVRSTDAFPSKNIGGGDGVEEI